MEIAIFQLKRALGPYCDKIPTEVWEEIAGLTADELLRLVKQAMDGNASLTTLSGT